MFYLLVLGLLFAIFYFVIKQTSAKKPIEFPQPWHKILEKEVRFYGTLSPEHQLRFQNRMMLFLSETEILGIKTEVEEIDLILIAASSVIPIFGFDDWNYGNLTVLLYPGSFNSDLHFHKDASGKNIMGMVRSINYRKEMILSKNSLRLGFSNKTDKRNTAIHEFVHLIDQVDGISDGIPDGVTDKQFSIPWLNLIHKQMEAINDDKSDIRSYGGTNQAEFFSVASEYFFERPKLLKRKHPELYRMLSECFRQPS